MNTDVIVFRDRSENVERHLCYNALSMHAKTAPSIKLELDKVGSEEMVEASAAVRASPLITVFEYREKFYVLTGHDLVAKHRKQFESGTAASGAALLRVKGSKDIIHGVRLITKHLAKKAVPSRRF